MALLKFDPPALVNDFAGNTAQLDGWSKFISATIDDNINDVEKPSAAGGEGLGTGKCQFYNETRNPVASPQELKVTWNAFPLLLVRRFGRAAALAMADEVVPLNGSGLMTRQQDEYCEWKVDRDPTTNQILRVNFTCEGPEYWQALAGGHRLNPAGPPAPFDFGAPGDKTKLLQLYKNLVGNSTIQLDDLYFDPPGNTRYNPWNKWNTTDGIVHLQQINNTLGAEINIGVFATVLRKKGGAAIPDAKHLICCSGFGDAERSSDPGLGFTVNQLAVEGRRLTLRNPIGIYLDGLDTSGFTRPNPVPGGPRLPIGNWWKVVRGVPDAAGQQGSGMVVRAVFEVPQGELGPDGKQLTVDQIQIAGVGIKHGGQIAEKITMKFVALAGPAGEIVNPQHDCRTKCCKKQGILQVVRLNDPCQDVFPVTVGPVPHAALTLAAAPWTLPNFSRSRGSNE